jgi:phosphoenolpyruvate carboxykinase (ATP)
MAGFNHNTLRVEIAASAASTSWDESADSLVRRAVAAGEGVLSADGAFVARTGTHTGRSPSDKFIVKDDTTADRVWWEANSPMHPATFATLLSDVIAALPSRELHVQNLWAGADPAHRMQVTVFTETAWHAAFIRNLLIRHADDTAGGTPVTILHLPSFSADPARHGTRTERVIALDPRRNLVIIAGTAYAGEIKKAVFTLFNFHAPQRDVLPMHCSANIGRDGDTALFFGLSGTGKTTLSNDPERLLIGDDEHGWTADGVFNLEGGCYAKTVKLSAASEPEIFAATKMAGTVLENVILDARGNPDFDDTSLTENTRAAYPLETLPAGAAGGMGGTPRNVVFLTADAFGVLPPLSRLTPQQAVYHFLSGYTAKVAGTERGVTEPSATFSACFGAPFMPLHPWVYGKLLAERLAASGATVWLLNTGWTGGAYGTGKRIDIASTRRLLSAALSGELDGAQMRRDPLFGLMVPRSVAGIDPNLLDPRRTWASGADYDAQATKLLGLFIRNFEKFGPEAAEEARGGPQLAVAAQ